MRCLETVGPSVSGSVLLSESSQTPPTDIFASKGLEIPTSSCTVHDRSVRPYGANVSSHTIRPSVTVHLHHTDNLTNDSVQTPLPYVFRVHLEPVVSLYFFIMPFTLVDAMGRKMVFIMFCINITFMSVEDVAAMIEKPFRTS